MENRKRVRYEKSPLVEVIFQLRFPTILSINKTQPADYQDRVRERYPFFQENIEQQGEVVIGPNGPQQIKTSQNKNYSFISADNKYKINLTSTFIAVSTLSYTQWEDFIKEIEYAITPFEEIYKPSFYIRVGLRYVDVISRSELGLNDKKWTELIQPHILGIVTDEIEDGINSYLMETDFKCGDGTNAKHHFELVNAEGNSEVSFLIDSDYFSLGTINTDDVKTISEKLHVNSGNFLASAITSELEAAMMPVSIEL